KPVWTGIARPSRGWAMCPSCSSIPDHDKRRIVTQFRSAEIGGEKKKIKDFNFKQIFKLSVTFVPSW
ncbi:MAG TPA: hypothetical protein VKP69_22180, partial [Isosphaeraceae bacterium]|nr:hypothetical protein [Isosphaeraceae bacterium]